MEAVRAEYALVNINIHLFQTDIQNVTFLWNVATSQYDLLPTNLSLNIINTVTSAVLPYPKYSNLRHTAVKN